MDTELSELLFNGLNEQGYLFQEACVHLLTSAKGTGWTVPVYDYSVTLPDGQNPRVDIVLSRPEHAGVEAYSIVECKRAHPDYAYWLFGAPNYLSQEFHGVFLPVSSPTSGLRAEVYKSPFRMGAPVPKSWMEVRRGRKSTQRSSVPQTIENAAIQVLLGTTGVASEQVNQRCKTHNPNRVYFFPVIATTARLFVADYSTANIDIESGAIARDKVVFGDGGRPEEVQWVQIDYPARESVALAGIPDSVHSTNLADLDQYKLRSIFVVNAGHLVRFFTRMNQAIAGIVS